MHTVNNNINKQTRIKINQLFVKGFCFQPVTPVVGTGVANQRKGTVRSAKRCRHCILSLLYSAYLRLESQNLTHNPPPHPVQCQCTLVKFWDFSFKLAEYICPKIQRRHLFADLTIPHLWCQRRGKFSPIQHNVAGKL